MEIGTRKEMKPISIFDTFKGTYDSSMTYHSPTTDPMELVNIRDYYIYPGKDITSKPMTIINKPILLEDLREETIQGKCPCTLYTQYTQKWDDLDCPIKVVNFKYNDIRYNAQLAILDFSTKMHQDSYKIEALHKVFRLYLFRYPYHIPGKEKIVNASNMGPSLINKGLWEHIYVKECSYEMVRYFRNEEGEAYHPTKLWGLSCSMNENDRVAKIGVCRHLNIENDNCDLKGLTSDASIEPNEEQHETT